MRMLQKEKKIGENKLNYIYLYIYVYNQNPYVMLITTPRLRSLFATCSLATAALFITENNIHI